MTTGWPGAAGGPADARSSCAAAREPVVPEQRPTQAATAAELAAPASGSGGATVLPAAMQ
ncbi:hypothetical protein Syun_023200 [Stephania yunnanensis]|uniref:Uncharacterized protein n=1 Tax=Stephania yunnanensis TaxID=152371 RepID=A0AAP0I3N2_9MAGN